MTRVFLTGAGSLLGQGIIKSLRASDRRYTIISGDPDPKAVGLHWSDGAHLLPWANDPEYLQKLAPILEREKPDIVLIGSDIELPLFAHNRRWIEDTFHTKVLVSDPRVVAIADDKWLTFQFLEQHGLSRPRSALATEPEALESLLQETGFPLVVKPRVGARSRGLDIVKTSQELKHKVENDPAHWIIQECVGREDTEYTTGLLYFDQDVRALVTLRRDLRDGNTYRAYVETESPHQDYLRAVTSALKPYGPVNLQFRLDHGVPKIFEINARFSGTTPLRALAGFNEVEAAIEHLLEGTAIPEANLRPAVILRHFSDTVVDPVQITALEDRCKSY